MKDTASWNKTFRQWY